MGEIDPLWEKARPQVVCHSEYAGQGNWLIEQLPLLLWPAYSEWPTTKGANGGKFDTAAALTSQIDVIALLGHTNYELSLCRREAVKPNLNKEYGSLCSSQTPVTTLLFGDELQAQLTAIRASNRISHTAVSHNSGSSSSSNPSWRQKQNKPF